MKAEDLNLLAQSVESMDLAVKELEKSIGKKDFERTKRIKAELLNFQEQVAQLIGK